MLVYDYGMGGDRVVGVRRQVEKCFMPYLAPRPSWAPWSEGDTLVGTLPTRRITAGNSGMCLT